MNTSDSSLSSESEKAKTPSPLETPSQVTQFEKSLLNITEKLSQGEEQSIQMWAAGETDQWPVTEAFISVKNCEPCEPCETKPAKRRKPQKP